MQMHPLAPTLVSHHLCPYVQRAAISLAEKAVPFERVYVDLADKPAWFLGLSPLRKTPVLKVDDRAIFNYRFTTGQVSHLDYFHPSLSGQATLASISWARSWWAT